MKSSATIAMSNTRYPVLSKNEGLSSSTVVVVVVVVVVAGGCVTIAGPLGCVGVVTVVVVVGVVVGVVVLQSCNVNWLTVIYRTGSLYNNFFQMDLQWKICRHYFQ